MIARMMGGGLLLGLMVVALGGCATGPGKGLTEIPPVPEGFVEIPSVSTGFRSAKLEHPSGTWVVTFHDALIKVSPIPFTVVKMEPKWYPEEGGADAALCKGYVKGNETLVTLDGSSDLVNERTWLFFEGIKLKRAVKYSLPGPGIWPDVPGREVPPSDRVKEETF